jgi:hypothetical protein
MEEVEGVVFLNSGDGGRILSAKDVAAGARKNKSSNNLNEFVVVIAGETGTVRFYSVSMKVNDVSNSALAWN